MNLGNVSQSEAFFPPPTLDSTECTKKCHREMKKRVVWTGYDFDQPTELDCWHPWGKRRKNIPNQKVSYESLLLTDCVRASLRVFWGRVLTVVSVFGINNFWLDTNKEAFRYCKHAWFAYALCHKVSGFTAHTRVYIFSQRPDDVLTRTFAKIFGLEIIVGLTRIRNDAHSCVVSLARFSSPTLAIGQLHNNRTIA